MKKTIRRPKQQKDIIRATVMATQATKSPPPYNPQGKRLGSNATGQRLSVEKRSVTPDPWPPPSHFVALTEPRTTLGANLRRTVILALVAGVLVIVFALS